MVALVVVDVVDAAIFGKDCRLCGFCGFFFNLFWDSEI